MGNSETEMEMGDGHDEEHEFDVREDTASPAADGNQESPNVHENGNEIVNGVVHSPKKVFVEDDQEGNGEIARRVPNGGSAVETVTPRLSGRIRARQHDSGGGRSSGVKRHKTTADDTKEAGTKEEQAQFMKELVDFHKDRYLDFKLPKFYGEPLNLLKLWRAVIYLGGYERVTLYKLWRQIGESFNPPKTCTTVSWTFRIFYEKSLLEFERHKIEIGELEFPESPAPERAAEHEGGALTSSGRVRRDAATKAMQGWHAQRQYGLGEDGEPKEKNLSSAQKREKYLKHIGVKQKKSSNLEHAENDMDAEGNKQLVATVIDVGPPADWVKINVRESKDCFEVYALVPGLLREEVRVQSDPSGRVVITGQPEQPDNPWGITPFKKIISLPANIDPLHTSAVVSLHGRLFVRVPFDR